MWDKLNEVFTQLQQELGIHYSCGHSSRLPHFMCSLFLDNREFYFTIMDNYVEEHTVKEIHDRLVEFMYQEICIK